MISKSDRWWEEFHEIEMVDLLLKRTPQQLAKTMEFFGRYVDLSGGCSVFDQCCGSGSLAVEMARLGADVYGVDLCASFIDVGRELAERQQLSQRCRLEVADAFQYVAPQPCDLVINWYSSFGYAASDDENEKMLSRAWESLQPGGVFLVDLPNYASLLRGFQQRLIHHGQSQGKPVELTRISEVDLRLGRLKQVWEWRVEGRPPKIRHSSLRLYWPHTIRESLERVGFTSVSLFGDVDGSALSIDSPRLVVSACRDS